LEALKPAKVEKLFDFEGVGEGFLLIITRVDILTGHSSGGI
jgi:hypothetical protein